MGTDDRLTTDNSITNATEAQNGKLPTVQHVKDYVDTRVTSVSGMVKFNEASEDYPLEINDKTLTLKLSDDFKSQKLKFIKIDGTFKKGNEITKSLNIDDGSLVQIGYVDNEKLVVTEPVWVAIETLGMGVKKVDITHSI